MQVVIYFHSLSELFSIEDLYTPTGLNIDKEVYDKHPRGEYGAQTMQNQPVMLRIIFKTDERLHRHFNLS